VQWLAGGVQVSPPLMSQPTLFAAAAFLTGVLAVPAGLSGQTLSLGAIAGAAITDAVQNQTANNFRVWSQSKDWIAGATMELRFPSRFSLELDAMYRELHATSAGVLSDGSLTSISPFPVVTWEFPVLAKYRFGSEKMRPFVEAGPSLRAAGNLNFNPSRYGVTAGFGVEAHWRGLTFAPTLRYTRWNRDRATIAPSQPGQVEFLLGVSPESESIGIPVGRRVSFGVLAGFGLTNDILPYTQSAPGVFTQQISGLKSPIAGPSVEINLARRFSVEVDTLHKSMRDRSLTTIVGASTSQPVPFTSTVDATWEFPVLAKHRFRLAKTNPFVEAGPSFRLPTQSLATRGVTGGVGVEMRWRALHIAPALRLTHWAAAGPAQTARFAPNEVALLAGFSLGRPSGAAH